MFGRGAYSANTMANAPGNTAAECATNGDWYPEPDAAPGQRVSTGKYLHQQDSYFVSRRKRPVIKVSGLKVGAAGVQSHQLSANRGEELRVNHTHR